MSCRWCGTVVDHDIESCRSVLHNDKQKALRRIEPLAKYAKETIENTIQPESFWQDILDTYEILKGGRP